VTCPKVDTTPGSFVGCPWDKGWRDRQLTDCFQQVMRASKAFADLVRTTSLACVHEKMGRIFRPRLQRSSTKFMFARMERLPSAIYDMKWCSAIAATALNSVWPVLNLASATLACCVLFPCCRRNEVLRRTYGKDNRVLHTAKLSQGFKVVFSSRTWQGAGISAGGTKIGVTGSETRTAKTEIEQGEATIMSKQKSCGVVVA
jgi:hypothetical protein